MEEKILELIKKRLYKDGDVYVFYKKQSMYLCIKDIASLFREFIEWSAQNVIKTWRNNKYLIIDLDISLDTSDELFDYWYSNIRNKV